MTENFISKKFLILHVFEYEGEISGCFMKLQSLFSNLGHSTVVKRS